MFKWDFIKAGYVTSAVGPEQYPGGELPEIAFIGRSNVGKSSLINSLCRNRHLAKVSGSPGKTRTVNFFAVQAKAAGAINTLRRDFFLVDLPGYGFARAGREDKKQWSAFIQRYITQSARLKAVFLLIDIRRDIMANDREAFLWLSSLQIRLEIILTKADKLSANAAARQAAAIGRELGLPKGELIACSAVNNTGRPALIDKIMTIVEN